MTKTKDSGARKTGMPLDLGVAALAAAAFGFAAFAMPADTFTSLVVQSGLPELSTAAQPPLGMKARGAAVAAAVLVSFGAVLLLLRALDRVPARARRAAAVVADPEAPRVRRADAHPDAPSRRPLLAGRELSEPVEGFDAFEPEVADEMFADLPAQPLPGFLRPDEEGQEAAEPAFAAEAEEEDPLLLDQPVDVAAAAEETADEAEFDAGAFGALVSQLPQAPEISGDETITDLMFRLESGLSRREQALGSEGEGSPDTGVEEEAPVPQTPSWLAPQPQAFEEAERAAAPVQPSVDELGEPTWPQSIDRREAPPRPAFLEAAVEDENPVVEPPAPEPIPHHSEGRVGHRLRNAIDEMQKIAARGG